MMLSFVAWVLLLILAWPLALAVLILYPLVWLLSIPFRLVGISVRGLFDLLEAVVRLPARLLSGPRAVA